jgi:superkiller protein 3
MLRSIRGDDSRASRLTEVARGADPDTWRDQLRETLRKRPGAERTISLELLAQSAPTMDLPAPSLALLGLGLRRAGDPNTAESVLRQGQRHYPRDAWLNIALADCLNSMGRSEEAIRYYMVARFFRPQTALREAHALEDKGETDEAIAIFEDLRRMNPRNGWYPYFIGRASQRRGRTGEAEVALQSSAVAFRETIRLGPEDAEGHYGLGLTLYLQGNAVAASEGRQDVAEEAIRELHTTIRLRPDYADAHILLGEVLADFKHDYAVAEASSRTAIRLQPNHFLAHYQLGRSLRDQGKLDDALVEYRTAIRLKPDDSDVYSNLVVALYRRGKPDEALARYVAGIRLKPVDAVAYTNLGNALSDQGRRPYRPNDRDLGLLRALASGSRDPAVLDRLTKSERLLLRAVSLVPSAAMDLWNHRAGSHLNRRQWSEAAADYDHVLDLLPYDRGQHSGRSWKILDLAKQEQLFSRLLELRPNDDHLWIGRARLHALRGQWS